MREILSWHNFDDLLRKSWTSSWTEEEDEEADIWEMKITSVDYSSNEWQWDKLWLRNCYFIALRLFWSRFHSPTIPIAVAT